MNYKKRLEEVSNEVIRWRNLAELNGWTSGHHISRFINLNQYADYMRACGKQDGMRLARKLTLREKAQKSTRA